MHHFWLIVSASHSFRLSARIILLVFKQFTEHYWLLTLLLECCLLLSLTFLLLLLLPLLLLLLYVSEAGSCRRKTFTSIYPPASVLFVKACNSTSLPWYWSPPLLLTIRYFRVWQQRLEPLSLTQSSFPSSLKPPRTEASRSPPPIGFFVSFHSLACFARLLFRPTTH